MKLSFILLIGVLFLTLLCSIVFSVWQVILEMQCLDLNLPNVNCTYTNRNYTTAVGILEPILSAVLVVEVFLFYFVCCPSENENGSYWTWCTNDHTNWQNVLLENWCMKRLLPTMFAIVYFILVYMGNLVSSETGPYRYISLIFGITSWFLLLTVSNENGSLSCVWKKSPDRQTSGLSARAKHSMEALSFVLFLFACLTNLVEFMVFTVYITKTLTPLNVPTEHKRALNALDFLGMTVVIALRLDFASFFGDMAILSLKDVGYGHRVKFLQDPWDERGNQNRAANTSAEGTNSENVEDCGDSQPNGSSETPSSQGEQQENSRTQNLEDNPVRDRDWCHAAATETSPLLKNGPRRTYSSNSKNSDII
ncbi:uncharacterized protein [Ptychodera flava]|uniref:uncharacterized protein n=1 Tax=Ptychodera flava TaxID=63121 RepID=UPI003969F58B